MAQSQPLPAPRVLVVESDVLLMMAMVEFVEEAGCEAVEASSVSEAIELLEARTDLRTVFADLDMQGSVTGMQLAAVIRDRWPPIELVLVSSLPWRAEALPLRSVLVGKPFDQRKIVAAIARCAAV